MFKVLQELSYDDQADIFLAFYSVAVNYSENNLGVVNEIALELREDLQPLFLELYDLWSAEAEVLL